VKLGLIGAGIARSSAPRLHRFAAELCGMTATYDLIDLDTNDPTALDAALEDCMARGYDGVNVTYPFKERALKWCRAVDPAAARVGAVNTVLLRDGVASGFNTDFTGFVRAFRQCMPATPPGRVAVVGAGGVARAVAFALCDLGAPELRIFDLDRERAERLTHALAGSVAVEVAATIEDAARGVDGIAQCTPLGMTAYPGTAVPRSLLATQRWAFDAVYTPRDTTFVRDARAAGLAVLEGYELFFWQGVHAFELFSGRALDVVQLRASLDEASP
jgi:shikimate dehydrogenase